MKIVREALAGTQESSDLMVKIAPADGELEIVIHSEVMKQFGEQIRQVVEETLRAMAVRQGLIIIEDKARWIASFVRDCKARCCAPSMNRISTGGHCDEQAPS